MSDSCHENMPLFSIATAAALLVESKLQNYGKVERAPVEGVGGNGGGGGVGCQFFALSPEGFKTFKHCRRPSLKFFSDVSGSAKNKWRFSSQNCLNFSAYSKS